MINDNHQCCQSPDINNFSKKNISPKKTYYNKSQEIIKGNITSRQKQNNKNKRNYSSITNANRNNDAKYSNNIQRKNKVLNDKIINISNVNKKLSMFLFSLLIKNFVSIINFFKIF